MPSGERRTNRAARIARGGLNPDVAEGALTQQPPIGYAIERNTACKAEIVCIKLAASRARQARDHVLGDFLNGGREIHLALRER
jgi:hypothetical protein